MTAVQRTGIDAITKLVSTGEQIIMVERDAWKSYGVKDDTGNDGGDNKKVDDANQDQPNSVRK